MTTSARILVILLCSILFISARFYIRRFGTMLRTKGVPTIWLFPRYKALMHQHLQLDPDTSLIDLGCGLGGACRFFSRHYTLQRVDGVDLNPVAVSRWNKRNTYRKYTNIQLTYADIFSTDISSYDYLFMFLMPTLMPDIESWLEEHMHENTLCIVAAFPLPTWTPQQEISEDGISKIFIYKKPIKAS